MEIIGFDIGYVNFAVERVRVHDWPTGKINTIKEMLDLPWERVDGDRIDIHGGTLQSAVALLFFKLKLLGWDERTKAAKLVVIESQN